MPPDIAQPLNNILEDMFALLLSIPIGIKANCYQEKGKSRKEERSSIKQHKRGNGNKSDQDTGQDRPQNTCGRIASLNPSIGRDKVVLINQTGNGCELTRFKADGQGGMEKADKINPPDREMAPCRHQRNGSNDNRTTNIS